MKQSSRLSLWLLTAAALAAQSTRNGVEGRITDLSGGAVPEVRLMLRGPLDRQTVSDSNGDFRLEGLRPGTYEVIAEKRGFEIVHKDVVVNGVVRVDLVLKPAPLHQVIEVSGAAELAGEAVLKMPASLHETPRAVSTFSTDELRERNLRNTTELLFFVPGMAPNSYRTGGYHFYARGYRMGPSDTRVDGFTGVNLGGGYGAALFGIEQVVVLRGPAGLQYGTSNSPGGFINLITKKPQPVRATRLDFRGGSYAGNGVSLSERPFATFDFDSTGALTSGGRILYRTLLTAENANYFTRDVLDKGRYAQGALSVRLDRVGLYTITPIYQYASNLRPAGGGIVASPTTSLLTNDGLSGPIHDDLSPADVNLSSGFHNYLSRHAGFDFRGVPTHAWSLNLSYRAIRNDRHINQFTPQANTAAQIQLLRSEHLLQRVQSKSEADNRYHNIDFNTSYELKGAGWRSMMQVGAYTLVTATRSTTLLGPAPPAAFPIHIYTGVQTRPEDRYPPLRLEPYAFTTNWNGYFQNRTSLLANKLVLTLGLGYGQSHPGGAPVRKGNLMPNFAALYNVTSSLALYGSYATSFNPVDPTLQDFAGRMGVFDPTTGKNYEFGAKYDLPNRRASATLSFFRNSVSNALVQSGINDVNVNGVRYYVEAGTRRGKGVELTSDYRLLRDVVMSAAVSYIDAIYTGTGPASAAATLAIPGSKAEKTPKWAWNTRLQYDKSEGKLAGFGAAFFLLWQDERLGSNGARTFSAPDPLLLPAYTRADASLSYRVNRHFDMALYLENLTDRRIFINATVGSSIEMAPPRTATVRLSYRF